MMPIQKKSTHLSKKGDLVVKPVFYGGVGKKGKAGLIKIVDNVPDALEARRQLFFAKHKFHGNTVTANGATFEEFIPSDFEIYFNISVSTESRMVSFTLSIDGGIDIEDLPPDRIITHSFDPLTGLKTGLAHGGNGFEGIQFIIDSFAGTGLKDPSKKDKKINVKAIANQAAKKYIAHKKKIKSEGLPYGRIPGINHPVFKGQKVNIDPREDFIYDAFAKKGITNLFWDFYKEFVIALYHNKGSKNIYCVNIDGVIAAISFKLLWGLYASKKVNKHEMQKIGFNLFLFGRTFGIAAEIDDHRNRGQDMDTRTPASEIVFVV